jgi:hypothetical protein
MQYAIYALAGISILLAVGGLGYKGPKHFWVTIASIISIAFSSLAIAYVAFWPLIVGFVLNWSLRLFGREPSNAEVASGLDDKD